MAAFEKALPEKIRKNAVQCVEYLVTSSPGAFENRNANQEALRWIQERHGKDNVIAAIIHRDEKNPHLSAYVVPKGPDTGRLNCRRFLGGAKALNEMQTDFARVVGRPVGLERGIEGSKTDHTKLKTYYGALERDAPEHKSVTPADLEPQVLKKGIFTRVVEDPEQVAKRISQIVQQHYDPAIQSATVARTAIKRAKEDRKTSGASGASCEGSEKYSDPIPGEGYRGLRETGPPATPETSRSGD
ncbi:plasmid recombination protein (plasmid) [Gluconobacter sphaericus]|uniref:MobV family relaxase n=1 Tax=Gluconobacter sphaericus TaxID=574987 RepID=UPI00192211A0|nr:MobV family relaxase [Gluconobacter sphaericus]QQX92817.1 plasmid recombination protein [Gluconobacter sphaericus]